MKSITKLLITAAAIVGFVGCGSDNTGARNDGQGSAIMALGANIDGVQYCVNGTITITDSENNIVSEVITDCEDANHQVYLQPGDYELTIPNISCVGSDLPPGAQDLESCQLSPNPTTFSVSVGDVPTPVNLSVTFDYTATAPFDVVFSVGSAVISLTTAPGTTTLLCGEGSPLGEECVGGGRCMKLDGQAFPECYQDCDPGNATPCVSGGACTPIGEKGDIVPNVATIGSEGNTADTLHVCVPASSGI